MKVKTRVILEQAIEEGVLRGWNLSHKHVDNPSKDCVIARIEDAVMAAIYDYFTFDDEND